MQLTVGRKPCLLLEAAELVFAQFNHIPAEEIVTAGEYCIPVEDVLRMQSQICALLPMGGAIIQFYFSSFHAADSPLSPTCLAFCMLYSSLLPNCSGVDDYVEPLIQQWAEHGDNYHVRGLLTHYSFAIEDADEPGFRSLAQEMRKLSVPTDIQMAMVEVFSNFEYHLRQVAELLRPAAELLGELMEPWVQRAQPLLDQWEAFIQEGNLPAYLARHGQVDGVTFNSCTIGLLYFRHGGGPGQFCLPDGTFEIMFSPDMPPILGDIHPTNEKLDEFQFIALRLLSNPARMEMLRLMTDRPMSPQELASSLNLHAGSVYRDLESLMNARLVNIDTADGRGRARYRTNPRTIQKLTERLNAYLKI